MKIKLSMLGTDHSTVHSWLWREYLIMGKLDKTPYATKECINELARGAEIDHNSKIDKIVVYKKKRMMYAYKDGKSC